MKIKTSVLNKFWKTHVSDKYGVEADTFARCAAAFRGFAKGHLLLCYDNDGQSGRMEATCTPNHRRKCKLGD